MINAVSFEVVELLPRNVVVSQYCVGVSPCDMRESSAYLRCVSEVESLALICDPPSIFELCSSLFPDRAELEFIDLKDFDSGIRENKDIERQRARSRCDGAMKFLTKPARCGRESISKVDSESQILETELREGELTKALRQESLE